MIEIEGSGTDILSFNDNDIGSLLAGVANNRQRIRVLISGELIAPAGSSGKCLISINDAHPGQDYRSYATQRGANNAQEEELHGFYVGRTGWNLDSDLAADYFISGARISNRIVGMGQSTFALGDNRCLTFHGGGYYNSSDRMKSIHVRFPSGIFSGLVTVQAV